MQYKANLMVLLYYISYGTKICFISVFLFLNTFIEAGFVFGQTNIKSDYYERGLAYQQRGEYKAALHVWAQAKDRLEEPSFKIGQAYIKLTAQQQMKSYYNSACEMYFWGLETNDIKESRGALLDEINFIGPLFSYKMYKKLINKAKGLDISILRDLRSFWNKSDPTPLTDYNERLLEHWRRIAFVKEHFSKPNSNETDDRADLYIRYGKPDYTRSGRLNYNSGTVNYLLDQRMSGRLDAFEADNTFYREAMKTMQFNLEARIRTLHEYPIYDIWIYEEISDDPEPAIFLFGSSDGVTYREKNSVEDFIPPAAFNRSNKTEQSLFMQQQSRFGREGNGKQQPRIPDIDITPALIMQLMYFRQLSALDPYFGEAFEMMISRYKDVTTRIPASLAREFESLNTGELNRLQYQVERQDFGQMYEVAQVPVSTYLYQFINEMNQPYYKVFIQSDVLKAGYINQLKKENRLNEDAWEDYILWVGVQLLDGEQNVLSTTQNDVQLNEAEAKNIDQSFNVLYNRKAGQIRGAVQLFDTTASNVEDTAQNVFDLQTIAMGKNINNVDWSLDIEKFEMSDIILGFGDRINKDIPFKIAHNRVIPKERVLKMYYEVYNLEKNNSGKTNLSFSYEIRPATKKFFSNKVRQQDLKITFQSEGIETRYSSVLEIKTADLQPGKYLLLITLEDLAGDRKINRRLEFQIR